MSMQRLVTRFCKGARVLKFVILMERRCWRQPVSVRYSERTGFENF